MELLFKALLVVHFIGIGSLLGSFLVQMRPPRRITAGYLHGALTMLVTGLGMVGLLYPLEREPDNAKIGVKLLVLLAIFALVLLNRKKEQIATGVWAAIGALTILNITLAVFW
jgi:heme A synthase